MSEQNNLSTLGCLMAVMLIVLIAIVGIAAGNRLRGHDWHIHDLQRRVAELEQKK